MLLVRAGRGLTVVRVWDVTGVWGVVRWVVMGVVRWVVMGVVRWVR